MTKLRLAGLSADDFLRRYWQKRPLLARRALPQWAGIVQRDTLFELAARDDLESRLVLRSSSRWQVRQGPFSRRELVRLPRSGWTLLVQGVDHALPAAQALLQEFAFIPYARLDDVMVSYAPPGGGVGPHFDSYDVFLLQLAGARRWRISRQRDLSLIDDAPLRILRRFRATREWVLQPGDLLYLPPRCAHDGVALTEGITCSIGFRAPDARELGARFLEHLQDRLQLAGIYEDPELRPQRHPARIGDGMARKAKRMLRQIQWNGADVERFLGCYLSEPKPPVVFARPARPLTARAFAARAARRGLRTALPTRMLFRGSTLFMNGEACPVGAPAARLLTRLADRRRLPPTVRTDRESAHWLYQWYRAGYIRLGDE
ncbi:MAG: cupin domain-containing protein [Betaproteobacteria bacterium]|nr:cupin domain-containing protein [Betaproteobacteria bacterium]